jgi:hypothetical protein
VQALLEWKIPFTVVFPSHKVVFLKVMGAKGHHISKVSPSRELLCAHFISLSTQVLSIISKQ